MIEIKSVRTSNEVTNHNEQGLMLNGTITTRDNKLEDVNFSIYNQQMPESTVSFSRHYYENDTISETINGNPTYMDDAKAFAVETINEFETTINTK